MVRIGEHDVDFNLMPPKTKLLGNDEESLISCVKSPSIYLFYIPIFVISFAIIVIKFKEVM